MQLLGAIPQCEINSLATNVNAAPTSFVSCGSDGHVRYWDTRLKKKDVLAFAVPNALGETDLMEIVWGASPQGKAADLTKAYTIAGPVLSCLDVRKAEVLSQHFYCNSYKVGGASSAEVTTVPVTLASFDACLKQHPLCSSEAQWAAMGGIPMCDDDGEVYLADPETCRPIQMTATSAMTQAYNGLLRPKASNTVSCGFTSVPMDSSSSAVATFVCGMDNKLLCYQSAPSAASNRTKIKGSRLVATIDMECLGEEEVADGGSKTLTAGAKDKRKDIANPPIPSCLAPMYSGDMQLIAIGRGDGSYVLIDSTPSTSASNDEEVVGGPVVLSPEVALVSQGHANNTIGCCLWVPPSLLDGEIVATYGTTKALVTIPTSGEITMWDVTKAVMPLDEEEEEEGNDGSPPARFATCVRGQGLAGPRSMMNCGTLLASGKGLLVGTSAGEVFTTLFD